MPGCSCSVSLTSDEDLEQASEGSTVTDGIGNGRVTGNLEVAKVDGALQGTNEEAVGMCYYLLNKEGLFVGPSAALNVAGAVRIAKRLGPNHTIVTVLCDGGEKYVCHTSLSTALSPSS